MPPGGDSRNRRGRGDHRRRVHDVAQARGAVTEGTGTTLLERSVATQVGHRRGVGRGRKSFRARLQRHAGVLGGFVAQIGQTHIARGEFPGRTAAGKEDAARSSRRQLCACLPEVGFHQRARRRIQRQALGSKSAGPVRALLLDLVLRTDRNRADANTGAAGTRTTGRRAARTDCLQHARHGVGDFHRRAGIDVLTTGVYRGVPDIIDRAALIVLAWRPVSVDGGVLVRILVQVGIEQVTPRTQRDSVEIKVQVGLAIKAEVTIAARLGTGTLPAGRSGRSGGWAPLFT